MCVMVSEPCPEMTAEDFHSKYANMTSEKELADTYAIASNQFWWVEDDLYDYGEGTPEYKSALDNVVSWKKILREYEAEVFGILKSEGVTIPDTGRIKVLIPFMERNGYADRSGWWIKEDKIGDYD